MKRKRPGSKKAKQDESTENKDGSRETGEQGNETEGCQRQGRRVDGGGCHAIPGLRVGEVGKEDHGCLCGLFVVTFLSCFH